MRALILEHPRPPSPERFNDIANTPLSSCLMAGYASSSLAEAGFETPILDARRLDFARVEQLILDERPSVLLVHAVYFWERTGELFDSLARLKQAGLTAPVCLFGFFPSLGWSELLTACPAIDYVVVGEPERTLVELMTALRDGRDAGVPGLARRGGGLPILTAPRAPRNNLDLLPFPARPFLKQEKTVSVQASRGCYNGCDFCLVPALGGGGNPWRGRSVDNVAREIALLRDQGKRDFYFVDANFIGPGRRGTDRTLMLAQALAGTAITFGMECRAADARPELMQALARVGLSSLLLGLESGSQAALNRMGKNSTPTQNLAAIDAARSAGLEPEVGFIMFEPDATLEDLAANLAFLRRARLLDRLGRTANLLHHHQIALMGTRLYARTLAEGRLAPEGPLGFHGRLVYRNPRVAWLAGAMRGLCLRVLKAMGEPDSGLHWRREAAREPYVTINALLIEQFERLLALSQSWAAEPATCQAVSALAQCQGEIEGALARSRPGEAAAYM